MSRTILKWREFESFNDVLEAGIQWRMAQTLFAVAWAEWDERYGDCTQAGNEIFDVMPDEIPDVCFDAAHALMKSYKAMNDCPILDLLQRAADRMAIGHVRNAGRAALEGVIDEFGFYLVMESLGHGVSWEDRYPVYHRQVPHWEDRYPVYHRQVPHYEFGYYDLPDDTYPIPEEEEEPDGDTE